ncbi:MAG TPA: hypothetical protein ENK23_03570 [Sorangium sp.]|nr:hypothetical protein [Sorangium sp.]
MPRPPTRHPGRARRLLCAASLFVAASAAAGGCFTDASGRRPDTNTMYFPTALTLSAGKRVLYVANSDFDLQYSAGWLQALDAAALRQGALTIAAALDNNATAAATSACAQAGLSTNLEPWLYPGPCSPFELAPYVKNARLIGAFASGILFVSHPDEPLARLFVPVRGDPSITYFDVEDDRSLAGKEPAFTLACGGSASDFCAEKNRIGRDPERTLRNITLPADPVGIASDSSGQAIITAHQTQNAASLVNNHWGKTPKLSYFAGNLPNGPTEMVALSEPAFVATARLQHDSFVYRPSFAVTFRGAAEVDLVTYYDDAGASPNRSFVVRSASVPLNIVASSVDSRGITVVDAQRRACEDGCEGANDLLACQLECAEQVPLKLYVANRDPASLLIGRVNTVVRKNDQGEPTSAFEELFFFDAVPLNFGPARVENGHVIDKDGAFSARVFITCFDSRTVFVFDPQNERVETVVRTGRGPHDVANDVGMYQGEPYALLYVGSFTDSYLGAIDLDMRRPSYGQVVANFGRPTPPKEER